MNSMKKEILNKCNGSVKCGEIFLINSEYFYCCLFCDEKCKCSKEFSYHIQIEHITDIQSNFNIEKTIEVQDNKRQIKAEYIHEEVQKKEESLAIIVIDNIEENIKCKQCGEYFENELALITHEKLHRKTATFEYVDCKKIYRSKSTIDHISTCIPNKLCRRTICNKINLKRPSKISTTPTKQSGPPLTKEILPTIIPPITEINNELKCNYCSKIMKTKQSFTEHTNIHLGIMPFKCDSCDKTFFTKKTLIFHEKLHTGELNLTCKLCNKSFLSSSGYSEHLEVHSGIRKYKCNICSFSFIHRNNLRHHLERHRGVTKYSCQYCNKKWYSLIDKRNHEMTHTGERPYQCELCGKGFIKQCILNDHIKVHENKREFICDICQKGFNTNMRLTEHKRIHSDKTLKCPQCEKCFRSKNGLRQHRKLHGSNKDYVCKICNKAFAQFAGLYSHKKMHDIKVN